MNNEIEENGTGWRERARTSNAEKRAKKQKLKENGDENNRSIFLAGDFYHHSRSSIECQFTTHVPFKFTMRTLYVLPIR